MTTKEREWMEKGSCHNSGLDFFSLRNTTKLERTCAGCPVKAECLEYALYPNQAFGYWAGTTPDDREAILEAREAEAK